MSPLKPFLIRAVYDWAEENNLTPYLLVDADRNEGTLPAEYVKDGEITLNIKRQAVQALVLGDNTIEFNTAFNGKPKLLIISVSAVMGIYARENGKGIFFDKDIDADLVEQAKEHPKPSKPSLKIVK